MTRLCLGLLAATMLIAAGPAASHEETRNGVTVAHPWARATPGGAKVGGAYMEIRTAPGTADRLVAVRTPRAGKAELHSTTVEGGVARMRGVDAVALPPGKSVVFEPGGLHVMLLELKGPLKQGDLIEMTLVFERAGEIKVEATVEPIGAMGPHGFDHQPGHPSKSGADAKSPAAHKH